MIPQGRAGDRGWLYVLAMRFSQFFDWVDKRQIDAQIIAASILYGSFKILFWSFHFAETANRPGLEVAAIIAAVNGTWAIIQASAIGFIFQARTRSFEITAPNSTTSSTATTTTTSTQEPAK